MPDTDKIMLFHYTSQAGLLGILKEKEIWATNIHFLNDYKEFRHAFDILCEIITQELASNPVLRDKLIEHFNNLINLSPNINVFVASFSERGDSLSQWRGYCSDGAGYSIGFDKSILQRMATEMGLTLVECIYDPEKQREEMKIYLDWVLLSSSTTPSDINTLNFDNAVSSLAKMLLAIAPRFKDKSFSEEREWRLFSGMIDNADERIEFRQGKSTLVPYVKFSLKSTELNNIPISKIFVGPTPDKGSEAAGRSCNYAFLLERGNAEGHIRLTLPGNPPLTKQVVEGDEAEVSGSKTVKPV
jgi:hypothetical protein